MTELANYRITESTHSNSVRRAWGFTLVELLVVIAIIMLLAGLLLPALQAARSRAKVVKAHAEVKQLDMAWRSVLSDYRTWALAGVNLGWTEMGSPAVAYLTGGNSRGIAYIEIDPRSLSLAGKFVDPWFVSNVVSTAGNVYQIRLGDFEVTVPHSAQSLRRPVAVWSRGPNGKDTTDKDRKDDVKSWE